MEIKKSLIDHWSLEQAGYLLNGNGEYNVHLDEVFANCLGGLSNFINALLLYDKTHSLDNGYAKEWEQFSWFKENTDLYITSEPVDRLKIDWNSKESYADQGISNYLIAAKHHQSDLFVSPERATQIKRDYQVLTHERLGETFTFIDKKIQQ